MNVKELIEELKKCSPDAVVDCFGVEEIAYYYDGYFFEIEDGELYFNITKPKVRFYYWELDDLFEIYNHHRSKLNFAPLDEIMKHIHDIPSEWKREQIEKEYKEYVETLTRYYKQKEVEE